ncbi:hypothetical protein Pelo_3635 [Pelomyxa schiedti]|nr:hypothetical protein Pelo_3635 [Pelomyxa schiedti]
MLALLRMRSCYGPFEKAQYADGSPSNAFSAPGHTSAFLIYHSYYSGKIDMSPPQLVNKNHVPRSETPGYWPVAQPKALHLYSRSPFISLPYLVDIL